MQSDADDYFAVRFKHDPRRTILWTALWDFSLEDELDRPHTLLELGAGRCEFINASSAPRKIAVDLWPGVKEAAGQSVEWHVSSVTNLNFLEDESCDAIFASNLFEHLTKPEFSKALDECKRVLKHGGRLVMLQPNFKYAYRKYFDDFTHVSIWTEVSLADYLTTKGWDVLKVLPKYLPLSLRSRLPVSRFLVWAYLRSPLKFLSGQMLLVTRKPVSSHPPQAMGFLE